MGRVSSVIVRFTVVSFSVVQLTSTSTPFSNKTWRYVELYSGITHVLRRADWDNIPTEAYLTAGGLTLQHPTNHVPVEKRGEGGHTFNDYQ